MTYEIQIIRDNVVLLERAVTADQVIDLLTSQPDESQHIAPEPAGRGKTSKALAAKAAKGKRKCGNCGKPGHTARTCDNTEASAPVAKRDPLTEEMFDLVKQRKEDGNMISSELALELGVPVREVNIAIFSPAYDAYLSKRKSENVL